MMHNYVVGRKCIEGFFLSFFLNQEMIRCEICILKGFKDDFTIKKITYDYDYWNESNNSMFTEFVLDLSV